MSAWRLTLIVSGTFLGVVLWALLIFAFWFASGDEVGKALFAG